MNLVDLEARVRRVERAIVPRPTEIHIWRNTPVVDGSLALTIGDVQAAIDASIAAIPPSSPGSGTDSTLWYINQDATPTNEDPTELRFGGGTGTNEGRWRQVATFASDLLDIFYQEDNAGAGTFAMQANSNVYFNYNAANTTARTFTLRLYGAGGGVAGYTEFVQRNLAVGGLNITLSSTSGLVDFTNGNWSYSGNLGFTVGCQNFNCTTSGSVNFAILDNSATSYNVTEGGQIYLRMITTNGSELVRVGNSGANGTAIELNVDDNRASAFLLQESTRVYIDLTTTNAAEALTFGNTTTNPFFRFLSSGSLRIDNGTLDARIDVNGSALRLNTETDVAPMITNMTTTQRNALTAQNGMMIYNTTVPQFEVYENGAWRLM